MTLCLILAKRLGSDDNEFKGTSQHGPVACVQASPRWPVVGFHWQMIIMHKVGGRGKEGGRLEDSKNGHEF